MNNQHSSQEKANLVIETLRGERTINEIAAEHGVHPTQISKWKGEAIKAMPSLFDCESTKIRKQRKAHDSEIDELHRQIGKLSAEIDWAKKKSGR
jgi:transposase-like protein